MSGYSHSQAARRLLLALVDAEAVATRPVVDGFSFLATLD
jgi:hypothetical protein